MTKLPRGTRKKLPDSASVDPKTRSYPIEDSAQALEALARSSGKPECVAVVRGIMREFPDVYFQKLSGRGDTTVAPEQIGRHF